MEVFVFAIAILAKGATPKLAILYRFQRSGCHFLRLVKNSARWLMISSLRVVQPRVPFCLCPEGISECIGYRAEGKGGGSLLYTVHKGSFSNARAVPGDS